MQTYTHVRLRTHTYAYKHGTWRLAMVPMKSTVLATSRFSHPSNKTCERKALWRVASASVYLPSCSWAWEMMTYPENTNKWERFRIVEGEMRWETEGEFKGGQTLRKTARKSWCIRPECQQFARLFPFGPEARTPRQEHLKPQVGKYVHRTVRHTHKNTHKHTQAHMVSSQYDITHLPKPGTTVGVIQENHWPCQWPTAPWRHNLWSLREADYKGWQLHGIHEPSDHTSNWNQRGHHLENCVNIVYVIHLVIFSQNKLVLAKGKSTL